jgi:DNA segregation ATPase FtsK/SpoIIIE-like protein
VGRNVLLGGEPGAGKSSALSVLIAAAALDPTVRIWGLDAKRLELALWRPVLDRCVGNDIDAAITAMTDLQTIMDDRYVALEASGRRKISPADGPLYMFAIDELRFFTAHSDRKKRQAFNDLAIDLAARGRAAGIILAAATQKPSTDVVPSSLRDLLAYRWAMRCTTKDASDTILGAGSATAGFSAATIDTRTPGVGLLLSEGDAPRRVRSAYLTDDEIRVIAARGKTLRDPRPTVQMTVVRAAETPQEPLRAGSRQASTATQRHPFSHQQDNR